MSFVLHPFFLLIFTFLYIYSGFFDTPFKTRSFFDKNGEHIGTINPIYDGYQIWTSLKNIPDSVVTEVIQKEDRYFYWNIGVNPAAVLKAGFENILHKKVIRGGSTITQQLAKNLIQEKEGKLLKRNYKNKIIEAALALGIELRHSKKWILEEYLNTAYYGNRCYGISAAANYYFSKKINQLTKDEIKYLVSLPQAPAKALRIYKKPSGYGRHFIEYASSWSEEKVINTTLDLQLQKNVELIIKDKLEIRKEEDPFITAAVVVLDVNSGNVLAMAGSRDYFDSLIDGQFNAAIALRQPGSALKPFTYFAAFTKGFSAETVVPDEPVSFYSDEAEEPEAYIPQNFDRLYHGKVAIRNALANSYNVPAVAILNKIGLSYYHDLLKKFGFTTFTKSPQHYGLSVTLGSGEVTLLELTNAYAAMARGGRYLPYQVLRDYLKKDVQEIIPNARIYASQITKILSDETARLKTFGFNDNLIVDDHIVAVKTGTSHENRDNWAIGYTPLYAVGVWVGHSDSSPLKGTTGASGAAPIWRSIMEVLLRGEKKNSESAEVKNMSSEKKIFFDEAKSDWKITSPLSHSTYRIRSHIPVEHQNILAEVSSEKDVNLTWYLDDDLIGRTNTREARFLLPPEDGKHILIVKSDDGEIQKIPFKILEEGLWQ